MASQRLLPTLCALAACGGAPAKNVQPAPSEAPRNATATATATPSASAADPSTAEAPVADVQVTQLGGSVPNAQRALSAMRAKFRACYQKSLPSDPEAQGTVTLTIRVGRDGNVTSVKSAVDGKLPSDVVGCLMSHATRLQFDPPDGGSPTTLVVPLVFVSSKR